MLEDRGKEWFAKMAKQGGWLYQAVESPGTGLGIPDGYFRVLSAGGWVEHKALEVEGQERIFVSFRPGQMEWLHRHAKLGGLSFLAVHFMLDMKQCVMFFRGVDGIRRAYSCVEFTELAVWGGPVAYASQVILQRILSGADNL